MAVIALAIAAGLWHSHAWGLSAHAELLWERRWFTSFALAGLTFALGMTFRHARWPRALTWLGLISYSVYLLHPLLVEVYARIGWTRQHHPFWVQVLLAGAFLAVLLAASSLSYLLVERPTQAAGRRLGRWLDVTFGPDRTAERLAARPPLARRTRAATE